MWKDIDSAPVGMEMFVVKAFGASIGTISTYTSDPYCVWQTSEGTFERWPHKFKPTHWLELPSSLIVNKDLLT